MSYNYNISQLRSTARSGSPSPPMPGQGSSRLPPPPTQSDLPLTPGPTPDASFGPLPTLPGMAHLTASLSRSGTFIRVPSHDDGPFADPRTDAHVAASAPRGSSVSSNAGVRSSWHAALPAVGYAPAHPPPPPPPSHVAGQRTGMHPHHPSAAEAHAAAAAAAAHRSQTSSSTDPRVFSHARPQPVAHASPHPLPPPTHAHAPPARPYTAAQHPSANAASALRDSHVFSSTDTRASWHGPPHANPQASSRPQQPPMGTYTPAMHPPSAHAAAQHPSARYARPAAYEEDEDPSRMLPPASHHPVRPAQHASHAAHAHHSLPTGHSPAQGGAQGSAPPVAALHPHLHLPRPADPPRASHQPAASHPPAATSQGHAGGALGLADPAIDELNFLLSRMSFVGRLGNVIAARRLRGLVVPDTLVGIRAALDHMLLLEEAFVREVHGLDLNPADFGDQLGGMMSGGLRARSAREPAVESGATVTEQRVAKGEKKTTRPSSAKQPDPTPIIDLTGDESPPPEERPARPAYDPTKSFVTVFDKPEHRRIPDQSIHASGASGLANSPARSTQHENGRAARRDRAPLAPESGPTTALSAKRPQSSAEATRSHTPAEVASTSTAAGPFSSTQADRDNALKKANALMRLVGRNPERVKAMSQTEVQAYVSLVTEIGKDIENWNLESIKNTGMWKALKEVSEMKGIPWDERLNLPAQAKAVLIQWHAKFGKA